MTGLDIQQKISQQQHLSARQYHALKLLEQPVWQLLQTIEIAMNTNPVMEYEYRPAVPEMNDFGNSENNSHRTFDEEDHFQDYDSTQAADIQEKRDYFFNSFAEERSMQDILSDELKYKEFSRRERRIADALTSAIDERGYLATPIADIAQSCNTDIDEIEQILFKLHKLYPAGIGARDTKECFKLQLEAENNCTVLDAALLEDWEFLAERKYDVLKKRHKISDEDIEIFLEKLRKLDPYPGNKLARSTAQIIIPEAEILPDGDSFILKVHDEYVPRIRISEPYIAMLADPSLDEETEKFLKEKIRQAEELCNALDKREKTIVRIARFIMENQNDFLYNGSEYLRPVTMSQAAEKLELHDSTVSRACSDKYLKTPQGVFPFKYFFSAGYSSRDGENVSSHAIEERIKSYIANEEPSSPLSDEKISNLLFAEGFDIARRTVAKYRKKLRIGTASQRKHRI